MFNINFCRWLDLNCGPLESEATALPTEPLPCCYNLGGRVASEVIKKFCSIGPWLNGQQRRMQFRLSDEQGSQTRAILFSIFSKKTYLLQFCDFERICLKGLQSERRRVKCTPRLQLDLKLLYFTTVNKLEKIFILYSISQSIGNKSP